MTTSGTGCCGLLSKEAVGNHRLVSSELAKMYHHLLEAMAVSACPGDINGAVNGYVKARVAQERCHNVIVDRTLEEEVRKPLELRRSSYIEEAPATLLQPSELSKPSVAADVRSSIHVPVQPDGLHRELRPLAGGKPAVKLTSESGR
jgi:hypothetical protein